MITTFMLVDPTVSVGKSGAYTLPGNFPRIPVALALRKRRRRRKAKEFNSIETKMADDSDSLVSETSPNKRLKSPTLVSSRKGKEKVEEITEEEGHLQREEDEEHENLDSEICGICLCKEGKAIRGWIDSCDHYFCFVCIMEWAKVESRCPMCKQRFKTIRRPPKVGIFSSERIVDVPVRNQVFHLDGNVTVGPSDPYNRVNCSICQSAVDENLLLLCDLCDSASHTYCVGLGAAVPEGDWYCQDCAVSRNEHMINQVDVDPYNQNLPKNFDTAGVSGTSVLNYEIVRDEASPNVLCENQMEGRLARRSSTTRDQSSTTVTTPSETNMSSLGAEEFEQGARALRQCLNLHGRIQALRENWNALRSGSLNFSSCSLDSVKENNNRRHNSIATISGKESGSHACSSARYQEILQKPSISTEMLSSSGPSGSLDVAKAWKMMEIAKSSQATPGSTRLVHHSPSHMAIRGNTSKEANRIRLSSGSLKCEPLPKKLPGNKLSVENYRYHPVELVTKERKSDNSRLLGSTLPGCHRMTSNNQDIVDTLRGNGGQVSQNALDRALDVANGWDAPICSTSTNSSLPGASGQPFGKSVRVPSSGCKTEHPKGKGRVNKNSECLTRKDDGAKTEIQSLVKLNLKLLTRDRLLGVDRFKEVARLATHTVLAACGLEHSKPNVRPYPSTICRHSDQLQQLHISNLMPGSCRECFYVFVKDVVNSIIAEKTVVTVSS